MKSIRPARWLGLTHTEEKAMRKSSVIALVVVSWALLCGFEPTMSRDTFYGRCKGKMIAVADAYCKPYLNALQQDFAGRADCLDACRAVNHKLRAKNAFASKNGMDMAYSFQICDQYCRINYKD